MYGYRGVSSAKTKEKIGDSYYHPGTNSYILRVKDKDGVYQYTEFVNMGYLKEYAEKNGLLIEK